MSRIYAMDALATGADSFFAQVNFANDMRLVGEHDFFCEAEMRLISALPPEMMKML